MKCALVSDLHWDFSNDVADDERLLTVMETQYLDHTFIVAGDTSNSIAETNALLRYLSSTRKGNMLACYGNHEFYDGKMEPWDNVETTTIDGMKVVTATMWTDFYHLEPLAVLSVQESMNDAKCIRNWDATRIATLAIKTAEFIFDMQPDLVVTHHCPDPIGLSPRHKHDYYFNAGYTNRLGNYIATSRIKAWCYGHTHHSAVNQIGNTMLYCHARGYPSSRSKEYVPMTFEI